MVPYLRIAGQIDNQILAQNVRQQDRIQRTARIVGKTRKHLFLEIGEHRRTQRHAGLADMPAKVPPGQQTQAADPAFCVFGQTPKLGQLRARLTETHDQIGDLVRAELQCPRPQLQEGTVILQPSKPQTHGRPRRHHDLQIVGCLIDQLLQDVPCCGIGQGANVIEKQHDVTGKGGNLVEAHRHHHRG